MSNISWNDVDRRMAEAFRCASSPAAGFSAAKAVYVDLHRVKTGRVPDGTPEQIDLEVEDTLRVVIGDWSRDFGQGMDAPRSR